MTSIIPINDHRSNDMLLLDDEIDLRPIYDPNLSHEFTNVTKEIISTSTSTSNESSSPGRDSPCVLIWLSIITILLIGIFIFFGIKFKWDVLYTCGSSVILFSTLIVLWMMMICRYINKYR